MRNYNFIFLLVLCFWAIDSKSQEALLDSTYVKETIRLAQNTVDKDSLFERMENALLVARSLNYKEGKKFVVDWLADYYRLQGDNISALRYELEFLENISDNEIDLKRETYIQIAQIYQTEKLYDKALEYYRRALPIVDTKLDLWQQIGNTFLDQNQSDSAIYYFTKVVQLAEKNKDESTAIQALQKQVFALQTKGDWQAVLSKDEAILNRVQSQRNDKLLAICYNNLGYDYLQIKDYKNAINNFEEAEKANKNTKKLDEAVLFTNLGIAYQNTGDLKNAINYVRKARALLNNRGDKKQYAYLSHMMSNIYYKNKDIYNALAFNEDALIEANALGDKQILSESYNTAALIHQELHDYEKALDYYKKHLALRDSFLLEERLRQQSLLQQQYLLERAEKEIKILISNQEIKDLTIGQLNLEKEKLELASKSLLLEAEKQENELALLRKEQEVQDATLKNKELEALRAQQSLRLTAQQLEAEKQDRQIAELNRKEVEQRLALAQKEVQEQARLNQIDSLNQAQEKLLQEQKIAQLELDKQDAFEQQVYRLGGLLAIILGLILAGLIFSRRANRKLAQQNQEIEYQKNEIEKNRDVIEQEKAKSDALLLNILPAETAHELKETGNATPRKYDLVSVLFTDFSGFTAISKHMTAEQLINELNECFRAFDEIIEQHGLEKIKTIGDAYMCAGGIPKPNTSNPKDVVAAALEIQEFMQKRIVQKQKEVHKYWNMRIGIHTGSVIAGVVGSKKFAYDIWGDTVNIASRMESNSNEGAINISASTYQYIKDDYECTYRGAIPVKNGGEVEMYFVDS